MQTITTREKVNTTDIGRLQTIARNIRISIIEMLAEAGSGHTAGALGMADIFTALYFGGLMKYDVKNPDWPDRDRLILSNGHICPVLYATMAHAGYFAVEKLMTLRKFGSHLQGHPHREWLLGLETSSGPLGSGLSQAVGMALAERMDNYIFTSKIPPLKEASESSRAEDIKLNFTPLGFADSATPLKGRITDKKFFCLMSDGEMECGQTWEAAMLAGKEKLHNLIGIIDRNNIQISNYVNNVMPVEPLRAKWDSWNWNILEIDGNNFEEIISAVNEAKESDEKPTVIIANTVAGRGVPEWEDKFEWHGKAPTKEEAAKVISNFK